VETNWGATCSRALPEEKMSFTRITFNPEIMGGKACIRGMRISVSTIVGLFAAGHNRDEILKAYPHLEEADIREALEYAAWRLEEIDVPLAPA
jgi:uncharacterized protein (DUF433 family)